MREIVCVFIIANVKNTASDWIIGKIEMKKCIHVCRKGKRYA